MTRRVHQEGINASRTAGAAARCDNPDLTVDLTVVARLRHPRRRLAGS